MRISAAAGAYYQQVGRWPSSVCDFEEFDGGHFFDLDWASLQETIVFEELPDGRLKIISTDPHYRFTLTMDASPDREEFELLDSEFFSKWQGEPVTFASFLCNLCVLCG